MLGAHTGHFLARTVNEEFRSHDKGSLYDLLTKSTDINPDHLKAITDEEIRPFLYIKPQGTSVTSQKAVDMIEQYLRELDVVYYDKWSDRDIFIQPGMRYAQCMELSDALLNNVEFRTYAPIDQRLILQKLESDICGQILEDIVFYQLTRGLDPEHFTVRKYRDEKGREVDLLIEDLDRRTAVAMEVKLSREQAPDQWQHLRNEEFMHDIESRHKIHISNKVVLYTGVSGNDPAGNGIYLNVSELLMNAQQWISELLGK